MLRFRRWGWLAGTLAILSVGCQTQRVASGPVHVHVAGASDEGGSDTESAEEVVGDSPSAARLHDIGGAILLYYSVNKRMPKTLDDLQTVADQPLALSSPRDGAPYGYSANGLQAPGRSKRIVVYESSPSPRGRWCILMPQTRPGAALSMEVLQVPEAYFLTYQ